MLKLREFLKSDYNLPGYGGQRDIAVRRRNARSELIGVNAPTAEQFLWRGGLSGLPSRSVGQALSRLGAALVVRF